MAEPEVTQSVPIEVVPTRDGYDRWAEVYDDECNPLVMFEEPRVIELLGDVCGLTIADIGCGTGRHAVRLANAGALVTGVDFSDGMVQRMREKPGAEAVNFVRHDLAQPLPFPDASFDRVLCCLVLDHIAGLQPVFGELHRLCRADGFVLVTVMHPAMELMGVRARFTDPATGRKVSPQSQSHQVSDYVMAALRAGLALDHLSEHACDAAFAARVPRAARYVDWPMLLVMRLRRREDRGSRIEDCNG